MSIKSNAVVIRDETANGANTADRVGGTLVQIADDLIAKQDLINQNSAKVGITPTQAAQIISNQSNSSDGGSGLTAQQIIDMDANTEKVGITSEQASDIVSNNAKVSYTDALVSANSDVVNNNSKVGITLEQSAQILSNNSKVGVTTEQASDIQSNNSKVGITSEQASQIVTNSSSSGSGVTPQQASDIETNNAKVGITSQQANDIQVLISSPDAPTSIAPFAENETLHNLIDFSKIVIGKKATDITQTNVDGVIDYDIVDEVDSDWSYLRIDSELFVQNFKFTLQGLITELNGNNTEIVQLRLHSSDNIWGTGFVELKDLKVDGSALFTKFNTTIGDFADCTWFSLIINIPIDSPERLANIDTKTTNLTFYSGWDSKAFDFGKKNIKYLRPFLQKTANLAQKEHFLKLGDGVYHKGYMKVKPLTSYFINDMALGNAYFYNSSFVTIGNANPFTYTSKEEVTRITGKSGGFFTTPADCEYLSIYVASWGIAGSLALAKDLELVIEESDVITKFKNYEEPIGAVSVSSFENRYLRPSIKLEKLLNCAFIGDSITFSAWYSKLTKHLQLNTIQAQAQNGISWSNVQMEAKFNTIISNYQNGLVVDYASNVINFPDYIFVFLGTNQDAVLGDVNTVMSKDRASLVPTNSMCEAIRYNVLNLQEAFLNVNTKIIGITPYQNGNQSATDQEMLDRVHLIEQMYERLSVVSFNLFSELGINRTFEPLRYTTDAVHLNDAGKELLCDYVGRKVKSMEF
tara:strand:+ start:160 stop:2412 length:2253 start_codon:yes stop_codon:yes gene_type:complete